MTETETLKNAGKYFHARNGHTIEHLTLQMDMKVVAMTMLYLYLYEYEPSQFHLIFSYFRLSFHLLPIYHLVHVQAGQESQEIVRLR